MYWQVDGPFARLHLLMTRSALRLGSDRPATPLTSSLISPWLLRIFHEHLQSY